MLTFYNVLNFKELDISLQPDVHAVDMAWGLDQNVAFKMAK